MMEHNVDIENLFEPGSEEVLESYLNLLHPADIAEFIERDDRKFCDQINFIGKVPAKRLSILCQDGEAFRIFIAQGFANFKSVEK